MAAQFIPGPGDSPQSNIGVQFSEALAKGMSLGLEAQRQQVLNQMAQQEMAFKAQQQPLVLAKQQLDYSQSLQANPLLIEHMKAENAQVNSAAQLYDAEAASARKRMGYMDEDHASAIASAAAHTALLNTEDKVKQLTMPYVAGQEFNKLLGLKLQAEQTQAQTQSIQQQNARADQLFDFQKGQQRIELGNNILQAVRSAPPEGQEGFRAALQPTATMLGMGDIPSQLSPTSGAEAMNRDIGANYGKLPARARASIAAKGMGLTTPGLEQSQAMLGQGISPVEQDLMSAFETNVKKTGVLRGSARKAATQPAGTSASTQPSGGQATPPETQDNGVTQPVQDFIDKYSALGGTKQVEAMNTPQKALIPKVDTPNINELISYGRAPSDTLRSKDYAKFNELGIPQKNAKAASEAIMSAWSDYSGTSVKQDLLFRSYVESLLAAQKDGESKADLQKMSEAFRTAHYADLTAKQKVALESVTKNLGI